MTAQQASHFQKAIKAMIRDLRSFRNQRKKDMVILMNTRVGHIGRFLKAKCHLHPRRVNYHNRWS
jgi:hypothetical protein